MAYLPVPTVFYDNGVINQRSVSLLDANFAYVSGKMVSAMGFGAKGDGSTDDYAAIMAAITYVSLTLGGGTVYFPKGQYKISAGLVLNTTGVRLKGAGGNTSTIAASFTTGDILTIGNSVTPYNGCAVESLGFLSSVVRTSGYAIVVNGCEDYLIRDNRIATTGGGGIWFKGTSGIAFITQNDIEITGAYIGMLFDSGSVDFFMSCNHLRGNSTVNSVGMQLNNIGGVYAVNCGIGLFDYGVHMAAGNGQAVNWTTFVNVLTDSCVNRGFNMQTAGTGEIAGTVFNHCWASSNGTSSVNGRGFVITAVQGVIMTGCRVVNNGGHGVELVGTNGQIQINGGQYSNNSRAANNTCDGIVVPAGYTGGLVINGINAGPLTNTLLLNRQRYGINVLAGAGDNYNITNNYVRGNLTGGVNDGGVGVNKTVSGNIA